LSYKTIYIGEKIIHYTLDVDYDLNLDPAIIVREWVPEIMNIINIDTVNVELYNDCVVIEFNECSNNVLSELEKSVLKVMGERIDLNGMKLERRQYRRLSAFIILQWEEFEKEKK